MEVIILTISKNNDIISVVVPREIKQKIKELAEKENRSIANYVATILKEHIEKIEKPSE